MRMLAWLPFERVGYCGWSRARVVGLALSAAIVSPALVNGAPALAATSAELYPDCSASRSTNCLVEVRLNGQPTSALKAIVNLQTPDASDDPAGTGAYFQTYFVQSEPVNYEPIWRCAGGGEPKYEYNEQGAIKTVSCPYPNSRLVNDAPVPTRSEASCSGRRARAGEGPGSPIYCADISQVAPPGSRIGVTINVGSSDPKVAVFRGADLGTLNVPNKSWKIENLAGANVVTAESTQGLSSFLDSQPCSAFPTPNDCGGPNAVANWTGSYLTMGFLLLDGPTVSPVNKQYGDLVKGMTFATNAQTNGPPVFDLASRTLSYSTAAPHFQQDGATANEGFISAFLPDRFLQSPVGFDLPPGLSPAETVAMLGMNKVTAGSAVEQLQPNVTDVDGGAIYAVPKFGFSSPKFDFLRRRALGAFTSKATATRSGVSVALEVAAKSKISVSGKLQGKSICSGKGSAKRVGKVTVRCKLTGPGRKTLSGASAGAQVNLRVVVKAKRKKTETKNTFALVP